MKIRDVMSSDVETISCDALLSEALKRMQSSDYGYFVVLKGDRLIGMITERDIAISGLALNKLLEERTVGSVMTKEILYCHDSDDADDVARNMALNKIRRLPVLDKQRRLVGIVSLSEKIVHSNKQFSVKISGKTSYFSGCSVSRVNGHR